MTPKKFISKSSNYRVVLKHSIPAEPMTGRSAVPGLYVKFENGTAVVHDEETAELLKAHTAFGRDFVLAVDEDSADPYALIRTGGEPDHDLLDFEYGTLKQKNPRELKRSHQEALLAAAKEMAKVMAKDLVKEAVAELKAEMNADKAETKLAEEGLEEGDLEEEEDLKPVSYTKRKKSKKKASA